MLKDSADPVVTIASPSASTAAQTGVTVTGSCEMGIPVVIGGAGLALAETVTCSAGSYSGAVFFTPGDGAKAVLVTQTDAAGNTGSASRNFIRDTVAPTIAVLSPANGTTQPGTTTITGTCEAGSGDVTIASVALASTIATSCSGAGTFNSGPLSLGGPDGAKTISISQADAAGNQSQINLNLVRDTTPPALIKLLPADDAVFQGAVTLSGMCESGLTVSANGPGLNAPISEVCLSSAFSLAVNLAGSDGSKAITIQSSDSVGNTATLNFSLIKDTASPTLTQTAIATSPHYTNGNSVTFGGACETGLSVVVSGAQSASQSCTSNSWTYATNRTSDGSYAYTFTQTDAAGNSSQVTSTWIRDATLPSLTLSAPTGGQIFRGSTTQTISWSGSDANATATPIELEYSINSGASWTAIASLANTGTYGWTLPGLNTQTAHVRARMTDLAGNVRTAQTASTFIIDSSAPAVALTSLTGGPKFSRAERATVSIGPPPTPTSARPRSISIFQPMQAPLGRRSQPVCPTRVPIPGRLRHSTRTKFESGCARPTESG